MGYSEENKALKKSILDGLKTLQKALESGWLLPSQVDMIVNGNPEDSILTGMAWTRDHLRNERAWPSPKTIEDKLFRSKVSKMDFEDLLAEVSKPAPSHNWFRENLPPMIYDIVGGNMGHMEPQHDQPLSRNYNLPQSHPDKVNHLNQPYFIPTDSEGFPLEGFNKDDLAPEGEVARSMFGIMGKRENNGMPVIRYPLPTISDNNRFLIEKRKQQALRTKMLQEKSAADDPGGVVTDALLKSWWLKEIFQPEYDAMKERLENNKKQLKELIKTGEVEQADYDAINVKAQMNFYEDEQKRRYLTAEYPDNLRRLEPLYRSWKEKKRKEKLDAK